MKKHRKLVALLVALTFLFSVVAPAMAANPSEQEKAADKLNVLGIIEGYPDGSFGLDRNITRAEFAKVAVIAAGLKDAAEQLVNFPSQFSDVATGEWYTGWINMAASQGFVKGDPAGTFRPNDNITYAEVITVLVRLLGYNDNLTGPWPTNYLAKAVELDITEGVALNASAPAVRGDVFIMAGNTLDCNTATWSTDRLDWSENGPKLIVKSFKGLMFDGLVTDISWDGKGNVYLDILGYDNAPSGDMKLVENVIITGAADPYGLVGKNVEFIRNNKETGADRNAVVYLGVKDTDTVSKDKAVATYDGAAVEENIKKFKIDGKTYDVADDFGFTFFPEDDEWDDTWDNITIDKVTVVLNDDGDAQWAFVYTYGNPDVIEEIDKEKVFGFGNTRFEYDEDDVQVFIKDGALVEFDALAEGDLVYAIEDAKNADLLVIAVSEVLEGTLEKSNADENQLTIDGKKFNAVTNYIISIDDGDSFDGTLGDVLGEDVKYMLSPAGTVAAIISGSGSSQDLYGMLEYYGKTARGLEARILNADGTKAVFYVDTDYSTEFADKVGPEAGLPVLVEYTLNSDGRIDEVAKFTNTVVFSDYDGNRAELGGAWSRVDSNTAYFGHEADSQGNPGKLVASDWSTFRDIKGAGTNVVAVVDRGVVKAMYRADVITGADNVGVVADTGRDKDGFFYEIFVDGAKVRYNATNSAPQLKALKGKLVDFDLASKKISDIAEIAVTASVYGEVESATTSRIEVGGTYYYIDEDTMIVDATGSTIKLVSRVGKGDNVQIHLGDKGVVDIIRIYKP